MSEKISITANDLVNILNGLNIAQKRGAFNFEESSQLLQPVQKLTKLLNSLTQSSDTNKEETNNVPEETVEQNSNTDEVKSI